MKQLKTHYEKGMHAHVVTIHPEQPGIRVTVHVDRFEHLQELDELFLYNFDADGNSIEFAFGERMENVEAKKYITYTTDPSIHRPPYRIEINHQLDTVDLENFGFTVSYELL
jgi:hypothetical protein